MHLEAVVESSGSESVDRGEEVVTEAAVDRRKEEWHEAAEDKGRLT